MLQHDSRFVNKLSKTENVTQNRSAAKREFDVFKAEEAASVTNTGDSSHFATLSVGGSTPGKSLTSHVPVWLVAINKRKKMNDLFDDASSVSHVNEDVAGALGLFAPFEKITVFVFNDQVKTFDAMPVNLTLESADRNLSILLRLLRFLNG